MSTSRNLRSLPTHRDIALGFSAKSCGGSPRTFAEKTFSEISDFYFYLRNKFFRARDVLRRNAKKDLFSWTDLYVCMYVCQHFQTSSPLKPLG